MKKAATLLLTSCAVLTALAGPAAADEPPDWAGFVVCTDSERYCAEVARAAQTEHPWRAYHKLTVWEEIDGQRRELWSRPYRHDGYAGGVMVPDGSAFVHVSFWYDDDTVLSIYRKEKRLDVTGRDFSVPASSLQSTVSHQLWLADGAGPYGLVDHETLRVRTRDGQIHDVNLKTGALKQ